MIGLRRSIRVRNIYHKGAAVCVRLPTDRNTLSGISVTGAPGPDASPDI